MILSQFIDSLGTLIVLGWTLHFVSDWLGQNSWMADNKINLKHPAAWVHSGIHTLLYLLLFNWYVALGLGISHILIDTRVPLMWWGKIIKQTSTGEVTMHVNIWRDQVVHLSIIVIASIVSFYFNIF